MLSSCELRCVREGCTFFRKGSDFLEFYNHVKTCKYQKVRCRYCRQEVNKKNLQRHETERCSHRRLKCRHEFCTRQLSIREKDKHERTCPFMEQECPNLGCTHVFAKKDKNKHMEICEYVQCLCKGCNQLYFRKDIYTHSCPSALPNHFRQMSHEETPENRRSETYTCHNSGCEFKGSHQDVVDHEYTCEFKIQQCPDCGARMTRSLLAWHSKECDRQVECEECGMKFPR